MKIKATFKEIKNSAQIVIGFGYCKIQNILRKLEVEPTLYNAGVYGWNCDFYQIDELFGVVTGYNIEKACKLNAHDLNNEFWEEIQWLEDNANEIDKEGLRIEFLALLEKAINGIYSIGYKAYYNGVLFAKGATRSEMKEDFHKNKLKIYKNQQLDNLPKFNELKIVYK